jgi:hypothetical protein
MNSNTIITNLNRASSLLAKAREDEPFYPAIFNITGDKEPRINLGNYLYDHVLQIFEGKEVMKIKAFDKNNKVLIIGCRIPKTYVRTEEEYCNLTVFFKNK